MMISSPLVGASYREDDQMDLSAIIRRAIEIGDQQGFITFDQIDEFVPSSAHRLEPEIIEALFEALSARGIHVREA
jgi:Sigma-70 factor, region 1.1